MLEHAVPHLPQLRWGPFLSRFAGEDDYRLFPSISGAWGKRDFRSRSVTLI
jgi:hypothetical protein